MDRPTNRRLELLRAAKKIHKHYSDTVYSVLSTVSQETPDMTISKTQKTSWDRDRLLHVHLIRC